MNRPSPRLRSCNDIRHRGGMILNGPISVSKNRFSRTQTIEINELTCIGSVYVQPDSFTIAHWTDFLQYYRSFFIIWLMIELGLCSFFTLVSDKNEQWRNESFIPTIANRKEIDAASVGRSHWSDEHEGNETTSTILLKSYTVSLAFWYFIPNRIAPWWPSRAPRQLPCNCWVSVLEQTWAFSASLHTTSRPFRLMNGPEEEWNSHISPVLKLNLAEWRSCHLIWAIGDKLLEYSGIVEVRNDDSVVLLFLKYFVNNNNRPGNVLSRKDWCS